MSACMMSSEQDSKAGLVTASQRTLIPSTLTQSSMFLTARTLTILMAILLRVESGQSMSETRVLATIRGRVCGEVVTHFEINFKPSQKLKHSQNSKK